MNTFLTWKPGGGAILGDSNSTGSDLQPSSFWSDVSNASGGATTGVGEIGAAGVGEIEAAEVTGVLSSQGVEFEGGFSVSLEATAEDCKIVSSTISSFLAGAGERR